MGMAMAMTDMAGSWEGAPSGGSSWQPASAGGPGKGSGNSGYWGGDDGGWEGASVPFGASGEQSWSAGYPPEPPAKRQKGQPVNTGDPQKDALIEKIKAFQRCGEEQRQAWWNFAEAQPGKHRDPLR